MPNAAQALMRLFRRSAAAESVARSLRARVRMQVEEMESRILHSADFAPAAFADLTGAQVEMRVLEAAPAVANEPAATQESRTRELVVVDTATEHYQQLVDDLVAQNERRSFEILLIERDSDGIARLSEALSSLTDVAAVHIISHGSDGRIHLGSSAIDADALRERAQEIMAWSNALTPDADLLIYGCDVAASADGRLLVDTLASLTGADVAASDDPTGSVERGGDWNLEYRAGSIETGVAISAATQGSWQGVLAVDVVLESYVVPFADLDKFEVKSGQSWGQTFRYDSAGATYEVDKFSVVLWRESDASAGQTITISLRSSWNGAALASGTISSNALGTSGAWVTGTLATPLTLNDNQTYYIRVDSGGDGKVYVGADGSGNYARGDLIDKDGNAENGKDMAFRIVDNVATAAPVLSGANDLASITEDQAVNGGTLVSSLIAGQATFDPLTSSSGIAVTAADNTNGTWQYSTNGGTSWSNFGAPTAATARLLAADANTSVRFVPNANWNGTVTNGLTFRAWDQTSGTNGGTADTSSPTLTVLDTFNLNSYSNNNGTANWSGGWVDSDGSFNSGAIQISGNALRVDVSSNATIYRGVDLSGATSATLSFSYDNQIPLLGGSVSLQMSSNGGGSYTTIRTFSDSSNTGSGVMNIDVAAFIAADTRIRLVGNGALLGGTVTFDNMQIEFVRPFSGGTTAFSSATASSSITVTAVNDAPVGTSATVTASEDTPLTLNAAVFGFTDPLDAPANNFTAVTIASLPTAGALTLSGAAVTAGQSVGRADIDAGNLVFTPGLNGSGAGYASFTFRVHDDGGTANGGVDLDTVARTMTIDVTAVNDAPINTTPAAQSTAENAPLTFSAANGNAIATSDIDASAGQVQVTLSAINGELTLGWPSVTAVAAGSEFRVNTATIDRQATLNGEFYGAMTSDFSGPRAVASDSAGNFVVVWSSKNQDGDGWGVYGQRYNAAGVPQGSEFRVNTTTAKDQVHASIAMNNAGSFVIVWSSQDQDGDNWGIYAQRFNAWGAPEGSEFRVNTYTSKEQLGATVAMDRAGNFVVAWSSKDEDGNSWGVYAQRYFASGSADGGVFRINGTTAKAQTAATVAMADDGRFVIAWASDDQDGDNWGVYAKRYDRFGIPQGGEFLVNTVIAKEQTFPSVAMDRQGDIVITWSSKDQDGNSWGVYAQRYDASGTAQGPAFLVNLTTAKEQMHSAVAMDADGDFVVTWTSNDQDGSGRGVYARQYSAAGVAKTGEMLVNTTTAGDQEYSSVAMDARGGFVVVWTGAGPGDTLGVFGQRFVAPTLVTFTSGDGADDTTMTFAGSIAQVNAVLDGLIFTPNTGFNGVATITIATDDQGNSGSGGARTDTDVVNIVVGTVNVDPTLTVTSGALAYTENDPPVPIDSAAAVSDPDSVNFDGGRLVVFLSGGGTSDDRLAIRNEGTAPGQIGISGGDVTYNFGAGPLVIGNWTGGEDGLTPLVITLNTNGTAAAVQALTRNVTYANISDAPSTMDRIAGFLLTDGDGGTSPSTERVITVAARNDAPVLGTGASVALNGTNEDTPSAATTVDSILTSASWADADAGALKGIAISAATGNGVWQYSTDGITWTGFGPLAVNSALLLDSGASIRYVPDGLSGEVPTFAFRAWDGTAGSASVNGTPAYADPGAGGGTTAYSTQTASASMVVSSVNDAPAGADATVTAVEDTPFVFDAAHFGFSDPNDNPAHNLLGVRIAALPTAGTLTLNGTAVTAGQIVSVADIDAGGLVYNPAADANGAGQASFTFQVQDDGGTANGGVNLDPVARTMTIDITAVNDAPVGSNRSVTLDEDTAFTFTTASFGFADSHDTPANGLLSVTIVSLPAAGTLTLNGATVVAGQSVSVADIAAGDLVYTPPPNAKGAGYANFGFQMRDDGGTANGGVDLDPVVRNMRINVASVNDRPVGTDNTVTANEDVAFAFSAAAFGLTDPDDNPANTLLSVRIVSLPGAGVLALDGVAVTAGQSISAAALNAGQLTFTAAADAHGVGYASFTFQVRDNGGTARGGLDMDATARTMTINVSAVNDAPVGTAGMQTTAEDTPLVFNVAAFGFSDPRDASGNNLLAVKITSLPVAGSFTLAGTPLAAGQFVSVADIAAGRLVYTPLANDNGAGYASFTFQVQDDGGAANGGSDLDAVARALTIDVTPVNDAPTGADRTLATPANTAYTFHTSAFGFSDPLDAPPNGFLAVQITSLPASGSLTLDNLEVAAGQFISTADVAAGKLRYLPARDAVGPASASFTFKVQDDGGGADLSLVARRITIDVTPPPVAAPVQVVENVIAAPTTETRESTTTATPAAQAAVPDSAQATAAAPQAAVEAEALPAGGATADAASVTTGAPSAPVQRVEVQQPNRESRNTAVAAPESEPQVIALAAGERVAETGSFVTTSQTRASTVFMGPAAENREMMTQMDQMRDELRGEGKVEAGTIAATAATSLSLSVGYVIWLLRGGVLLSTLVSSVPAWRFVDPLPVLGRMDGEDGMDDEGDDSLESLVSRGDQTLADEREAAHTEPATT